MRLISGIISAEFNEVNENIPSHIIINREIKFQMFVLNSEYSQVFQTELPLTYLLGLWQYEIRDNMNKCRIR